MKIRALAVLTTIIAITAIASPALAVYHPTMGRFMQRDPNGTMTAQPSPRVGMAGRAAAGGFVARDRSLGRQYADGMSLYQYVSSNPIRWNDPSGLYRSEAWCNRLADAFADWYYDQLLDENWEPRENAWLNELPACPCRIPSITEPFEWSGSPDKNVWTDPTTNLHGFHPGAKWCMRTKKPTKSGAGQQCCYDCDGNLITHGLGAGTPDKKSPEGGVQAVLDHYFVDVAPATWAKALDTECDDRYSGPHYQTAYLSARPPNPGSDPNNDDKPCPRNPK